MLFLGPKDSQFCTLCILFYRNCHIYNSYFFSLSSSSGYMGSSHSSCRSSLGSMGSFPSSYCSSKSSYF
ncbi:hypothetical protein Hanom_Chr14g01318271 [Helianthus anomalus]